MTKAGTPPGPGPEKADPKKEDAAGEPNPTRPPREGVTDDRPSAKDVTSAAKGGAPTKK